MKGGRHWFFEISMLSTIIWTLVTGNHHSCLEDEVVHVKRSYFKSPLFQQPSLSVWRGWTYRPGLFTLFCSIICAVCWQVVLNPPSRERFLTRSRPDPGCSLRRVLFRSAPQTWHRRGRLSHPWIFQKQIPSDPLAGNTVPSRAGQRGFLVRPFIRETQSLISINTREIKGMAWGNILRVSWYLSHNDWST